ncbi:MAG: elongation factor P--(R)-beta-lysine ligase [Spirochaetales bacterium]|nr:elongation factor P--(R)-beta-lysine ligase [Spirochaetales bacterium]
MNREISKKRSNLYRKIRSFFDTRDYTEVETPVLSPDLIPEVTIEVFETLFLHPFRPKAHFYLVPSPEVWMKRLIAEGFGDIYQIARSFRNAESIGSLHNPEFTLLEWYTMGADYRDSIGITEELFKAVIPKGISEDLRPPFRRISMAEAFKEFAGITLENCEDREVLRDEAERIGISSAAESSWEEIFHLIFLQKVELSLPQDKPLVLYDYPSAIPCLARDIPGTPWKERWELYIRGVEVANCYTEEDNFEKVAEYFLRESRLKKEQALIPCPADMDYGKNFSRFPRCSGVAMGLDRLLMLMEKLDSIGGVILFPFSDTLTATLNEST